MKITKAQLRRIIKEELDEHDPLLTRAAPAYVIMHHRGRFGSTPVYITSDPEAAERVRDALLRKSVGGAQRGAASYELQVWNGHDPTAV